MFRFLGRTIVNGEHKLISYVKHKKNLPEEDNENTIEPECDSEVTDETVEVTDETVTDNLNNTEDSNE